MPIFPNKPGSARRRDGRARRPRPFSAAAAYLLMAAAFIALWLLATGLPEFLQIQSEQHSRTSIDAGDQK
jgi:hypothetical protein